MHFVPLRAGRRSDLKRASADELVVSHGSKRDGLLEQAVEQKAAIAGGASVEAEGIFVE